MFGKRNCCYNMNEPRECPKQQTIMEPQITNCVEKEFYYEVPHVIPIHTHVINKHIYNHTYTPEYSCSSENQIINNDCGCNNANNFINR